MSLWPRRRGELLRALLVLGAGLLCGRSLSAAELSAVFDAERRELVITARDVARGDYDLTLVTPGLTALESGADVGEPGIIYLPPATGPVRLDQKVPVAGAENWFFFNSLAPQSDWALVARFPAGAAGTWKLNGRFSPQSGVIAAEISLPVTALEVGENVLHVRHANPPRPELSYRRRVKLDGAWTERVRIATSRWRGEIALFAAGDAIARTRVESAVPRRGESVVAERWWERREEVRQAMFAVGRNVLNAQVKQPGSLFFGGFNLVYDTQHEAYRMPHWIWAWGPSIAFLLELEKHAARGGVERGVWRDAALAAGRRSLNFGLAEEGHPARGISTVRWEPSRAVPGGWVEYLSTADSLFLAGWGWMSVYAATGEQVFRARTEQLVEAAQRLMGEYPVVPQDWVVQRSRWTPHTLDESVFGMIGFRELHGATADTRVAEAGRRFLESHLKHMGRKDGLLERAWMRDEDRAFWDPDIKGHAWVVEGYLDAHGLSGDRHYLELARQLTARVLACQAEDGSWAFLFEKPRAGEPRDDKGTAIWAYMLYQLYKKTGDAEHLAAARRAVGWCLRHQYRGEHAELDGGLLNTNSMAYVRRRPLTILYSTTFLGLALHEELSLARD
jgi:hypothetical protein